MIKIGTRHSALALWQAQAVQNTLENAQRSTTLVEVSSQGDQDQDTPLHQFGTTGIFTKALDDALRQKQIDVAVHSLKDYPTDIPEDFTLAAVLPRGPHQDIIAYKGTGAFLKDKSSQAVIATGSIRRKAQWLQRYPQHEIVGLRGNVQTRLRKLSDSDWHGAIFAKAGLERVDLLPPQFRILSWMLPAPAQGVVGIMCRSSDHKLSDFLKTINHSETFMLAQIERQFLNTVEGGCSAPVGALAQIKNKNIHLSAGVFSLNGKEKATANKKVALPQAFDIGIKAAQEVLKNGGREIMNALKNE